MGVWNTFKSSYQSQGIFGQNGSYHPGGFGAAFSAAGGMSRPAEGFLHAIKRGIVDNTIETGNTGMIMSGSSKVRYGGSVFGAGGRREIMHEAEQIGTSGAFKVGARRGMGSMIGRTAFKLITPAMFLYTASTEGLGEATKQTVETGAIFGAARWAWGRGVAALGSPIAMAGMAAVGVGIAAQKALTMGKKYGEDIRKVSFGNAFHDTYGNAATMRQAGLMAIQSSKVNGRNALGNEASLFHMR
jgi:hypothetical protein